MYGTLTYTLFLPRWRRTRLIPRTMYSAVSPIASVKSKVRAPKLRCGSQRALPPLPAAPPHPLLSPLPLQLAASVAMSISDADLRAKLRPVFDKFDVDGSGAVSTDEMKAMVTQLKMDISPQKLRKMMVEADPDMSGEIDFEEFLATVKKQVAAGNGGDLVKVVELSLIHI